MRSRKVRRYAPCGMLAGMFSRCVLIALVLGTCACTAAATRTGGASPVTVHLFAFNDFHVQLTSPAAATRIPDSAAAQGWHELSTGGVAWLSGLIGQLKAQHPLSAV